MADESKTDAAAAPAEGAKDAVTALLLTSQMGRHHDNISWVKFLLDTAKVRYEELNCDLPENKDARSRYWGISGKRVVYPQLFVGDEFIGDREGIEDLNDAGTLVERLEKLGVIKKEGEK